ncbi:MAG: putative glycolipid-binding domain-containing protein [Actinobacteria bacterium]|nr:putative glycolipid-binding domain-containing protein [Actinomycetota bacterium]
MSTYTAPTAAHSHAGHRVQWTTWAGDGLETATIRWENEGFTITGVVSDAPGREHFEYVLRLTAGWQLRQFLLFRDLDEPDLWLATDGSGRWGEMNGAHRTELDGCYDVHLACTPLTHTLPIRRIPLLQGDSADIPVALIDPDTLAVRADAQRYTRLGSHSWRFEQLGSDTNVEFTVDEVGLVVDYPSLFRRLS